jgi:hypothetical protein
MAFGQSPQRTLAGANALKALGIAEEALAAEPKKARARDATATARQCATRTLRQAKKRKLDAARTPNPYV